MALSESMFLFELVLEKLEYGGDTRQCYLKGTFADIFSLTVQQPKNNVKFSKKKDKPKFRAKTGNIVRKEIKAAVFPIAGSVLFACNVCTLMWHMKTKPIQISLWKKHGNSHKEIGTTSIPWKFAYLEFLHLITTGNEAPPVNLSGDYLFMDESTNHCAARIKLVCKLCLLDSKIPKLIKSVSESHLNGTFLGYHSSPVGISCTFSQRPRDDIASNKNEPVVTIYKEPPIQPNMTITEIIEETHVTSKEKNADIFFANNASEDFQESKKIPFPAMDACDFNKTENGTNLNDDPIDLEQTASTGIDLKKFMLYERPQKEPVYFIGYCLMDAKDSKSTRTSPSPGSQSTSASNKISMCKNQNCPRMKYLQAATDECDSDCPVKGILKTAISERILKAPQEEAGLLKISSCTDLACPSKKRLPPQPPNDNILLDFDSNRKICCKEEISEVNGEMKTTVNVGDGWCECTCECKFNVGGLTRYCTVCGGFEKPGEDFARNTMHPCPIFHKLVDMKRLNSSGSGSRASSRSAGKKVSKAAIKKDIDSESDNKSKKKRKDDRFKFNYGYQGIPPHIGHDNCASPCTGTMDPVPKTMGWLWTADNVPGMKERIAQGWKPGAVSKRLLSKLNKAKLQAPAGSHTSGYRAKKGKKLKEVKPTLIVCKQNGEYIVEMQCTHENGEPNLQATPLKYKIASANNEERVRRKEKLQARLIRRKFKEIWGNHYHPEICEKTCLKAYHQAIGLLPYNPNKPECNCYDAEVVQEETESDGSDLDGLSTCSSEVNWELQFSPPIVCQFTRDRQLLPSKVSVKSHN